MELRKFDISHYETVVNWWKEHNHPVLPFNTLSTFSFISFKDDQPIAVSFMYVAGDCDYAQIGWTTTNPNASLRDRYEGVDMCTKGLLELARKYKKTNVMTLCASSGLMKMYQKNTFKKLLHKHDLLYSKIGDL